MGEHAEPVRDDGTPCALVLQDNAPKRQRLNPQATLPHDIAAPPIPPEQLMTPDHDILSVRQTANTVARGKPASRAAASDQAIRPPPLGYITGIFLYFPVHASFQ
jgi:hypothetical protein